MHTPQTMLRQLTLSRRLSLLLVIVFAGFISYGAWSFKTLNEAKVGGPQYVQIATTQELVADVLPPPLYIIESYLVCLEMASGIEHDRQWTLVDQLRKLHQENRRRHDYWRDRDLGPELNALIRDQVDPPTLAFYATAFDEFLPAVFRRDTQASSRALNNLARNYEKQRLAVDAVVVLAKARADRAETQALQRVAQGTLTQMVMFIAALVVAIAFTVLVRKSITGPIAQAVGVAKAVAGGNLIMTPAERFPDEPGQLLVALQDMGQSLNTTMSALAQSEQDSREAHLRADLANRSKSEFLANMSHEIRTPMNAILGMTGLALRTDLNAKQRNYLEKVNISANSLLGIINDILDFSKIEAGKLHFEHIDFSLLHALRHLSSTVAQKVQDKGLELLFDVDADVPDELIGDELRLGQILLNLVNNAIKFTANGEISVRVHALENRNHQVLLHFEVQDTGIGISAEQRGRLFQAFSQADSSTTRQFGGTGLGLTISASLVAMMGGKIDVNSEPGIGSCFFFTAWFDLPETTAQPAQSPVADLINLRVLVVDDNQRAREIMSGIVSSLQSRAHAVASGPEALVELAAAWRDGRPYHVVMMDWRMPEMDGLETIRLIHEQKHLSDNLAKVMVTAFSRDEMIEQAGDTKLDAFLEKPVSRSAVLDVLTQVLGHGRKHVAVHRLRESPYQLAATHLRGRRVLLVEDNEINQELACELLKELGMSVDIACDGAEGVAMVQKSSYDVVLMDWQMPVMDGIEATRCIRQDPQFSDLPILAMTANAMAGDREKCLAVGMNDHVAKPIVLEQLVAALTRWVRVESSSPSMAELITPAPPEYIEEDWPDLAGVDTEAIRQRMRGNLTLYLKLLRMFHDKQGETSEQIRALWAQGQATQAIRLAHTLKGLAGNLGAVRLQSAAHALEQAMSEQGRVTDSGMTALINDLAVLLGDLRKSIEVLIPDRRLSIAVAATNLFELTPQFQELARKLANNDPDAVAIAEQLSLSLAASKAIQGYATVLACAQAYDFDGALSALTPIARQIGINLDA